MSPLTKNFKSLTNNKVSLSSNGSCGSAVEPASCYQKELKCPRYWTPNCWWAGRHHQCVNVCEMLNVLNVNVTLRWTWSELIRLSSPQVNNTHTHTHTHTHTISATSSLWFEFSPQIFFTVWLRLILLKYKGAYCPHLCVCLCVCVCVCVWMIQVCVRVCEEGLTVRPGVLEFIAVKWTRLFWTTWRLQSCCCSCSVCQEAFICSGFIVLMLMMSSLVCVDD